MLGMGQIDVGKGPKVNKYAERFTEPKLLGAVRANWSSSASSAVQSFRWLLFSHALPVGSRMTPTSTCVFSGEEETIEHLFFECKFAEAIWDEVYRDWLKMIQYASFELKLPTPVVTPRRNFWNTVFRGGKNISFQNQWTIVQGIVTYHIWRTRCAAHYNNKLPPPPKLEVPFIWQHVFLTLQAEAEALRDIKWWWIKRSLAMNPHQREVIRDKVLPGIETDLATLEALLGTLTHTSQRRVADREDGLSNTVLPYRNRYSNPYWYLSIVDPTLLENK
jgi:hypothetical protein